jgi:hypothetical protein
VVIEDDQFADPDLDSEFERVVQELKQVSVETSNLLMETQCSQFWWLMISKTFKLRVNCARPCIGILMLWSVRLLYMFKQPSVKTSGYNRMRGWIV